MSDFVILGKIELNRGKAEILCDERSEEFNFCPDEAKFLPTMPKAGGNNPERKNVKALFFISLPLPEAGRTLPFP